MSTLTTLGFIKPVDADAPDGPTQIGGNADKADELLQRGGVAGHIFSNSELTRTSTTFGAFSIPMKVELPRVKENQMVQIFLLTALGTAAGIPSLQVVLNGGPVINPFDGSTTQNNEVGLGAGGFFVTPVTEAAAKAVTASIPATGAILLPTSSAGLTIITKTSDLKPFTVELQGKAASGTVRVYGAYLAARALA